MWKLKGCPRCGGDVFLSREDGDWYMECLQCSYTGYLNAPRPQALDIPVKGHRKLALVGTGISYQRREP
ncbi:MAG: hypothetical protein HYX79_10255 [Chloroflexi bacterium]|nr:hypothetical protein [Chloroflexota bacterium]